MLELVDEIVSCLLIMALGSLAYDIIVIPDSVD